MRALWRELWPPALTVAVALCLWQAGVALSGVPAYLLPAPTDVAAAFVADAGGLVAATARTGAATLMGFALAVVGGVLLGAALSAVDFLRRGVYPLSTLLQMVPLVAVAPLLTIWFGYGGQAVVAASAVVAIFPVIAATVDGLRSADPGLVELFDIYGASRWQRWWKLELPSAAPSIVTGARVAAGLSVIGAVVGEFVSGFGGAQAPIGIVILAALREARTDRVFAAIGLSALVGFAVFGLVSVLGHLALRAWHPSAKAGPSMKERA